MLLLQLCITGLRNMKDLNAHACNVFNCNSSLKNNEQVIRQYERWVYAFATQGLTTL